MQKSQLGGRISWPAALVAAAVIAAIVTVTIFLRLESWPRRTVHETVAEWERVAKDLRSAFIDVAHLQPRISINNRTYLEQTTLTTELAVLSRRIEIEHEFRSTWAGSSKRVKLHGTFLAKAGFDLGQSFSVDLKPNEIQVQLPRARILALEQQQLEVLAFENGLWNRISGMDVQNELLTLMQLAREKAVAADLPGQAEHSLEEQLQARFHPPQPLRLTFITPVEKEEPAAVDQR
jgi:hypothetical protein